MKDADKLRARIKALDDFMSSEVYPVWIQSREVEAAVLNQSICDTAGSWDEVIELRARRENTLEILKTFEELRETLKAELEDILESESQLAATSTR